MNVSTTQILQHQIEWFLREDNASIELDECSIAHIETCIKEGYREGELCVSNGDNEYRGWWTFKKEETISEAEETRRWVYLGQYRASLRMESEA